MTSYACREHPDEPVTWRGTGCVICEQQARKRQRRHRDERHADSDANWPANSEQDR